MKKKTILIFLLTIVTLTMTAQDKLIRVDSESLAWQKDNPQYLFADKEKARPGNRAKGAVGESHCQPEHAVDTSLRLESLGFLGHQSL